MARPPSKRPAGSMLKTWVVKPHHPAMTSGCIETEDRCMALQRYKRVEEVTREWE